MKAMLNSGEISRLMCMPYSDEPSVAAALGLSSSCIYIGRSMLRSVPYFLDFGRLINPHIFAVGMTGSGKSYLIKSLALKLGILLNIKVIVIDFTGEYEILRQFGMETVAEHLAEALAESHNGIIYIDLSGMDETKKVGYAKNVLSEVIRQMRASKADSKLKFFTIIDEAWKLLLGSGLVETLVREGRKYGFGVIMASQMLGDAGASVVSNIGTMFVFRINDSASLQRLAEGYLLNEKAISTVKDLNVGSCLLIQIFKSGSIARFFIKRVSGTEYLSRLRILAGEKMEIEVGEEKFNLVMKSLGINDQSVVRIKSGIVNGTIRLPALIAQLIQYGVNRELLLYKLRGLGISDEVLADNYAIALAEVVKHGSDARE